jgi:hypothetical protein
MSTERSRRDRFATNPVPWTWEIPVAMILAGLFVVLITPLVVQGLVGWLAAGEFAWPTNQLPDAYAALCHGRFGAGLRRSLAVEMPPNSVMWLLTVLGEALVLGAAVVVGPRMRDLTGANSRHGLATAAQAAEALGLPRLRKGAAVIRPDLYARPGRQR